MPFGTADNMLRLVGVYRFSMKRPRVQKCNNLRRRLRLGMDGWKDGGEGLLPVPVEVEKAEASPGLPECGSDGDRNR